MIEVTALLKAYGDISALKNISFSFAKGGIHGVLGAVGSGKTTLCDILSGVIAADLGIVRINGADAADDPLAARRRIGYLPQVVPLYENMTVYEYLLFIGEAKGVSYDKLYRNINSVMELTDITEVKNTLTKKLYQSQRRRLGIAQTMLGNPDVIILDEPFSDLDGDGAFEMKELVKKLGEVKTIIISSSSLDIISELCDDMIIMSSGEIIAQGELGELEGKIGRAQALCISVRGQESSVVSAFAGIDGLVDCVVLENKAGVVSLRLEYERGYEIRDSVFSAMADAGYPILSMETRALTLEDVYLKLIAEAKCESSEKSEKKVEKKRGKRR